MRRPGHTAIHLGLFTVVASLMLCGLMIQAAAATTMESAKRQVGAVATMQFDINGYVAEDGARASNGPSGARLDPNAMVLSIDVIERLCADAIVTSCNYGSVGAAYPSPSLRLWDPSGTPTIGYPETGLFQVQGVRTLDDVSAFHNADNRIVDGTGLTAGSDERDIVIDKRLAGQNNLKVGDAVKLYVGQLGAGTEKADPTPYEFAVVGIFESDTADAPAGTPPMMQPSNLIYTTVAAGGLLSGADTGGVKRATFTLADPNELDALRKKAQEHGIDPNVFPLTVNDKLYEQLIGPIQQTASGADAVKWASLVAGCVILALVVASSLRARRREVGVLLSLGESKPRVLGQQFVELVSCALLAVGIATGLSQLLAPTVASAFLAGRVSAAQNSPQQQEQDYGNTAGGLVKDEKVDPIGTLDVGLRPGDIGLVTGAVLGITGIAIVIPGLRLARQHPRDILTKGA